MVEDFYNTQSDTKDVDAEKDETAAKEVAAKKESAELKKGAATPAKPDHLDFLTISLAKNVKVPTGTTYERGCRDNPKQKDEAVLTKKAEAALKKKEAADLKKQEADAKKKQVELNKQEATVKKKEAGLKKQKTGEIKKTGVTPPCANVIRVKIPTLEDSSIADVTYDVLLAENELLP
ncbi:Uncharacterized protein Rs2_09993 [Raphanus sativus]|nr:Uncharacterized protein Rs2_09993 [Raphanus sativus]